MNNRKALHRMIAVIPIPIMIGVWWIIAQAGFLNPALFPSPPATFHAFIDMIKSGELLSDSLATVLRVLIGLLLGVTLGVILGILTARVRILDQTIGQIIQLLRPVPPIALVPLSVVWLGISEMSKISIIVWGVFFPVWVNTHVGVASVNKELIWAARSLGANNRRVLLYVVLPASLRYVISGMRVSIAIAFICVVVAEMSGAYQGLGYRMNISYLVFRVDRMIGVLALLGTLGALADFGFVRLVNRFLPWCKL